MLHICTFAINCNRDAARDSTKLVTIKMHALSVIYCICITDNMLYKIYANIDKADLGNSLESEGTALKIYIDDENMLICHK